MHFSTLLIVFASVALAYAAPNVADQRVEAYLAEIRKMDSFIQDGVKYEGLASLKRTSCQVEDGDYVCQLESDSGMIVGRKGHKSPFHFRITIKITPDNIKLESVKVELLDSVQFQNGLVGSFSNQVMKTIQSEVENAMYVNININIHLHFHFG